MESTLNKEFVTRVKTMVEELDYSLLDEDFFSPEFYKLDKKAYIKPLYKLNNVYSENRKTKTLPSVVITFRSSKELKDTAIVLFDELQRDSGMVKLIDASNYPLENDNHIPVIQNLIYHQAYPGCYSLKFPDIYEDWMDDIQDHWDEYTQFVSYTKLENKKYSWFLNSYYDISGMIELGSSVTIALTDSSPQRINDILFSSEVFPNKKGLFTGKVVWLDDLKEFSQIDYVLKAEEIPSNRKGEGEYYEILDKEVVVVSLVDDNLRPTLIDAKGDVVYVPLLDMAVIDMKDIDAEYLVRELQKDYVTKQIKEKLDSIMDDKGYILQLLKIRVPSVPEGQSYIGKQREYVQNEKRDYIKFLETELKKERTKYLKKYEDICEYCNEQSLKDLLIKLEKDEISNARGIFTEVRKVVEWVSENCLHLNKYSDSGLNVFSKKINDDPNIPEYIARSFHICVNLGNEGSHRKEKNRYRTAPLIDKSVEEGTAPYVVKSVIYCLLNILYWCKDLDKDN